MNWWHFDNDPEDPMPKTLIWVTLVLWFLAVFFGTSTLLKAPRYWEEVEPSSTSSQQLDR